MNAVCAGSIAFSDVDTWMYLQLENVLHSFLKICPELTIEKIRVD